MVVKVKKLDPEAVIPIKGTIGSAAADLTAISDGEWNEEGEFFEYKTGIAIEMPYGYVGLIFPRSSNTKKNLVLGNSVAVIDSDFRGEITLRYKLLHETELYKKGDRIGQIMFVKLPEVDFIESQALAESDRGSGGFGSTGI